jgi:hypothetical protein
MNIPNESQQIPVFFAHDRLVPTLKQMADFPMGAIEVLRIGLLQSLHKGREGLVSGFHQQMHMIRHQTLGPQTHPTGLAVLGQPLQIRLVIGYRTKCDLPMVPPDNDMIEHMRGQYTWTARHEHEA